MHTLGTQLKEHFSNIHTVIIAHVEQAQSEIASAIAWFTDGDIFEVHCTEARGVKVSVALIADQIKRGPGGLNVHGLSALGGNGAFLPTRDRQPALHHKFCVIDLDTVAGVIWFGYLGERRKSLSSKLNDKHAGETGRN